MTANPARWHADPTGRHQLRYWNGTEWTEHVSDRGAASNDPLPSGSTTPRSTEQLMPSSEGRSTPASHDPVPATLRHEPVRTQRAARSQITGGARRRPTPIVTKAGWSSRTKLLVAFIVVDAIVAATVILFVLG